MLRTLPKRIETDKVKLLSNEDTQTKTEKPKKEGRKLTAARTELALFNLPSFNNLYQSSDYDRDNKHIRAINGVISQLQKEYKDGGHDIEISSLTAKKESILPRVERYFKNHIERNTSDKIYSNDKIDSEQIEKFLKEMEVKSK